MNAYLNARNYFKRTSSTNCEIKTYTGSLQISLNITSMIWLNNSVITTLNQPEAITDRKWQDYVYIQCEYKSTKQKIKHLLREENKVKENKIS